MVAVSSKLLIDEHPLQVLPSLAELVGLNEAIFLQQLHYWLRSPSAQWRDGRPWVYNTYDGWHAQFPFWSKDTVKRVIRSAERAGFVLSTTEYNSRPGDQTKWYSIDHEALDEAIESSAGATDSEEENQSADSPDGLDQSAKSHDHEGNLHPPTGQSAPHQGGNLPSSIQTETSTETTEEIKGRPPAGEIARAEEEQEPSPPVGGMFVRLFDEALERTRAARPEAKLERVSLSGKWRRNLKRAADAELAAGRDPDLLRKAAERLALRVDQFPGMELAEAVNDVLLGKPYSVEQEEKNRSLLTMRGKRSSARNIGAPGGSRAERTEQRTKDYEWLFGEDEEVEARREEASRRSAEERRRLEEERIAEEAEHAKRLRMIREHMQKWRSEMDEKAYALQVLRLKNAADENGVGVEEIEALDGEVRAAIGAGRKRAG